MEFKKKQSAFCDSGYNKLDWDESRYDKQEDSHAEKALNENEMKMKWRRKFQWLVEEGCQMSSQQA